MEPPPECRQETPALTEAAAEFLRLIGGCPPPPAPGLPFIPQAVPGGGVLGAAGGDTGSGRRGTGLGGLSRINGEGLSPAGGGAGRR